MSDRDTITLPREVGEHLTKMLEECPLIPNQDWSERDCAALTALRKALAAEQPKQEALCWFCHGTGYQKNPVYPALVPCPNCKPKEVKP